MQKLSKAARKQFIYDVIYRSTQLKGNRTPGYFKNLLLRYYNFVEEDLELIAQVMRKVKKDCQGKYGQGFIPKKKRERRKAGEGFRKKNSSTT